MIFDIDMIREVYSQLPGKVEEAKRNLVAP